MNSPSPAADSRQVLRANALSFPSVLMQSTTHIAPAVGLVFVLQFITTMAGIDCPWYVLFLAAVLLITLLIYRGIEISAIFVIWLTAIEILIVGGLAISGFLHSGDGRIHLEDFGSLHSFHQKGFYLAVAFSILIFTGFESVAPLAEETRNPRRTLPRAVLPWPCLPDGAMVTSPVLLHQPSLQ
jgi:amino acid transporter